MKLSANDWQVIMDQNKSNLWLVDPAADIPSRQSGKAPFLDSPLSLIEKEKPDEVLLTVRCEMSAYEARGEHQAAPLGTDVRWCQSGSFTSSDLTGCWVGGDGTH